MQNLPDISTQLNPQALPEGSVARATVIHVLQGAASAGGYSINVVDDTVTLVCSGVPEVYQLPAVVGRRMIARLAHKYKVKIEYFYHPEILHPASGVKH